jgi:hypothetical protein
MCAGVVRQFHFLARSEDLHDSGENYDCSFSGCDTMQSGRWLPEFQMYFFYINDSLIYLHPCLMNLIIKLVQFMDSCFFFNIFCMCFVYID